MKFFRILPFLCCAAAVVVISCKKDDSTTTTLSLTGSLGGELPHYVEPGYTKVFKALELSTLKREDEKNTIGYYFTAPITALRDTVKREDEETARPYTFEAPDSLGTFSLIFSAFSEGYYGQSVTMSFAVIRKGINGKASMSNYDIKSTDKTFTDSRDGKKYYYSTIGGVDWMRQNLAWEGAGYPYQKYAVLGDVLGMYYNWNEAQTACPEGWRLPNDEDWIAMSSNYCSTSQKYGEIKDASGRLMENVYFNFERMWTFERYVNIDNRARLSLIPSGFANIDGEELTFQHYGNYAALWTADEDGNDGGFRYIYKESDNVHFGYFPKKEFYMSVRCMRESIE